MIKAIIGLGNPGPVHFFQRHNIGFRIVDKLADQYNTTWSHKPLMDVATIHVNNKEILLIKPQTFMNSSGKVVPFLAKQGIQVTNILVIHDELEKPFGNLSFKQGGSHKGHNGLKSIIEQYGADFLRFRFGIGRPRLKEDVPKYVLQNFDNNTEMVDPLISQAMQMITNKIE
ncbi:aminoacyl-tRNA hydrolase [Candidatus Dependentiae bacterium]|nr:MAG: aminoacyl-tRNA hydrolase [Candidatus Dependentiae bacterium]